ncbi:MAG: aldose 1-epimerase [Candidatus Paceibacteria bacterium]|jgi:aldose 1-epimerase
MIELETEGAAIQIDPACGARLASLCIDGQELLISRHVDPMRWGCYSMVPFAGRVRDGRFKFDGQDHELPRNLPPHAIHGTCFTREWEQLATDQFTVDLGPDWPFAGFATQQYTLSAKALTLRLEVHALDVPFPASIGWHPWFRRQLSDGSIARLKFTALEMYQRSADGIPSGELVAPGPGPWDDCFRGMQGAPRIEWGDRLRLQLESNCSHWVVYDEPSDAICVEPQTGEPDALNRTPKLVSVDSPLCLELRLSWGE